MSKYILFGFLSLARVSCLIRVSIYILFACLHVYYATMYMALSASVNENS